MGRRRAPWRLRALALPLLFGVASCGGATAVQAPTTSGGPGPPRAGEFSSNEASLKRFDSLRFHLSIPLPDGASWRVDDHSRPELFAEHPATRSSLTIYEFTGPELMNRQRCEARSREMGLVPTRPELRTLEDTVTVGPEAYDSRIWVALSPGDHPGAPLGGHVFAFGAFIRKCLLFHYASDVTSDRDESILTARLAVARIEILAGIRIIPFDEPPRDRPAR